jgi:transcriptional regulator with XRE-family HTH domain
VGDKMNQEKLNRIIGKNIKKYRRLCQNNGKNMTQEKLAELINVSVSHISSLESSKSKKGISIPNLYKISNVLKVPIHKFFEDNDD